MRNKCIAAMCLSAMVFAAGASVLAQENATPQAGPKSIDELYGMAAKMLDEQGAESGKVMSFFKASFPERIAAYEKSMKESPDDSCSQFLAEINECKDILAMQKENPEEYKKAVERKKMEIKADVLADAVQVLKQGDMNANRESVQKKEQELKDTLSRLFDLKLQEEKRNLECMQKDLDAQKERLKRREANKEKIVGKRLDELTGGEEDIDW